MSESPDLDEIVQQDEGGVGSPWMDGFKHGLALGVLVMNVVWLVIYFVFMG